LFIGIYNSFFFRKNQVVKGKIMRYIIAGIILSALTVCSPVNAKGHSHLKHKHETQTAPVVSAKEKDNSAKAKDPLEKQTERA
jgi:hypothetical protein